MLRGKIFFLGARISRPDVCDGNISGRRDRDFPCHRPGGGVAEGQPQVKSLMTGAASSARPGATMPRSDSEMTVRKRFARTERSLEGRNSGSAFRHHLLRLQHNPARHRCYPCSTHARSEKTRLLLAGVDDLRLLGRDVDRLRRLRDVHDLQHDSRRLHIAGPPQ